MPSSIGVERVLWPGETRDREGDVLLAFNLRGHHRSRGCDNVIDINKDHLQSEAEAMPSTVDTHDAFSSEPSIASEAYPAQLARALTRHARSFEENPSADESLTITDRTLRRDLFQKFHEPRKSRCSIIVQTSKIWHSNSGA